MKLRDVAVLFTLAIALAAPADPPGVFAITNATIHPVSGPEVRRGVVVIRNGLIEAVGPDIPIPADATLIDAASAHVYPGLIDAYTSIGFVPPAGGGREADRPSEPTPATMAAEQVRLTDADLDSRRITGVTTIITVPSVGIFAGQSAVLNLSDDPAARVVRQQAAMHAAFRPRPAWTFPDSLMGVVAHLRQTFSDAQHHAAAQTAYQRNPAQPRPAASASLDALLPVIRREMPLVFEADSADAIRRAQAIAREFNLRLILAGAQQAWKMSAAELGDSPVLVSVDWPSAPAGREDREEQPLRVIRDRVNAPTTPSVLARRGARFALVSGRGRAAEFLPGIRRAIEEGLSADDALRAATLTPAQIFGLDRQLGSLERGKIANVIVTDRPIFERASKVTRVFVDGRELRPQPAEETRETSPIDGTWTLSVRAPEGNVSIMVTLNVRSGHVSGTYSGDRGSGDIAGGMYDRPTLQFSIVAQTDAETHDWVFRGTVDDDAVEGTVSTNLGTLQFSGSRPQ